MSKEFGLLWLRVLMGLGIAYHGYGKLFGGKMDGFSEKIALMHIPMPLIMAWAAALSEFLGGILIVLGLKTRIAALFVFITMCVAVFVAHQNDPFRVKELALAYLTMAGTLFFVGPGKYSLDRN